MPRDDFTAPTIREIAARAGHRCSNPTCRRGTSRPDPEATSDAITTGTACHISAASVGGPRYDAAITIDERRSAANGLWLCATCGRVVDANPEAYPVETLVAWKRFAEASAARDSQAAPDIRGQIIADVAAARDAMAEFSRKWRTGEPGFNLDTWDESLRRGSEYLTQRHAAFDAEILPLITDAIMKSETILGPSDARVLAAKAEAPAASVNYFTHASMIEKLQELVTALELR